MVKSNNLSQSLTFRKMSLLFGVLIKRVLNKKRPKPLYLYVSYTR